MRRFCIITILLTVLLAGVSVGQGPLTNAMNLMVRTSTGGDLLIYGVAAGAQGPLTNFGNIRLRTYGGGDLGVAINGGTITPDCLVLDATNQDWSLCRSAANVAVIAAGDSLNFGAAGVNISADADGAITFLGLGNGFDEDLTLNLDDTTNTGVFSSSTGLTALNFTLINLGLAEGSASAPSLSPTNFPDTGLYFPSDDIIDFSTDGSVQVRITTTALQILTNAGQLSFGASADLKVFRDAANTLARRDGTANQTDNHYARYVSTTNFNRTATKDISATQSGVTGATVTATSLIPDGCALVSVTTSVTTGLGISNGTTGYSVGDGADADRWGTISATAAGTDTDNTDWTVTTLQVFNAAQNVVLTALTGNFDGTGVIVVHVGCLIGEAE